MSGPQVISYLMNWGDRFTSHQYVSIFWSQLSNALKEVFPFLLTNQNISMEEEDSLRHMTDNESVSFCSLTNKFCMMNLFYRNPTAKL